MTSATVSSAGDCDGVFSEVSVMINSISEDLDEIPLEIRHIRAQRTRTLRHSGDRRDTPGIRLPIAILN